MPASLRKSASIALGLIVAAASSGAAQIQIKTGTCSPASVTLESRVACFVKVREYADVDGLLDLISPTYFASLAADYRLRYDQFIKLTPDDPRGKRIESFAAGGMPPGTKPDTNLLRIYDEVFRQIEAGASGRQYMRPVFVYLFLWSAPTFSIRTSEVEIANQTDSTAKLYLTQKLSSPLTDQQYNFERRFVFLWKKEGGTWYLVISPG